MYRSQYGAEPGACGFTRLSSTIATLVGPAPHTDQKRKLLATTSILSLVGTAAFLSIGAPRPAAAQCATTIGPGSVPGCANPSGTTLNSMTITNATVTGNVSNAGVIAPGGISLLGSTINGDIVDSGTIAATGGAAGISLDNASRISTPGTAISIIGTSFSGGIRNGGTISASFDGIAVLPSVSTFQGGISNTGTIISLNTGILLNTTTFSGGVSNSGTISAGFSGIAVFSSGTFSGGISNSGTISAGFNGINVSGNSTFSGGITNSGRISAGSTGISVTNVSTFAGGISNTGSITGLVGIRAGNSGALSIFDSGTIVGTGGTAVDLSANSPGNTFTLGPGYSITGKVLGTGSDVFQLGGSGNGSFDLSTIGATQQYQGFTTFNVVSGVWTVSNTFGQTEPWNVNGGTLAGTGTLSSVNVNNGGTLAPGIPGTPGGTLNIAGNLAMTSGATYLVNISPAATSLTKATGTATVAGTIAGSAAPGAYTQGAKYTVLTAAGGVSGTFSTSTLPGLFGSMTPVVNYDANNVFLVLQPANLTSQLPPGSSQNTVNVANGITAGNVGTPPLQFQNLFGFTPSALQQGLSRLAGEVATGAERAAFGFMNSFLTLLTDPVDCQSRLNATACEGGRSALSFAPDREASLPPDIALANASVLDALPKPVLDLRWTAWGTAYGGSNTSNGNATVGSNNVTTSTFGFAGGMDYHFSPDTLVGFALGGGGTNWGLANALGTGRSDAFQAGARVISWFGPAYVNGSLAFANHWFTTNRSALSGDALNANFTGQSYGARLEGGYRYAALRTVGVTPYAALQAQDFHMSSYSEGDPAGSGFGLTHAAMDATDVRSELGTRFDASTLVYGMPLILRGRIAWAHDSVSNQAISAAFESLPGSNFVVNGAAIPQNSALTSVGAQLFMNAHWSLAAKFDGEFASGSQTYAGSATLRYSW